MDNGSRMTQECHVRFCERLKVKFHGPTYLGGFSLKPEAFGIPKQAAGKIKSVTRRLNVSQLFFELKSDRLLDSAARHCADGAVAGGRIRTDR